MKKKNKKTEILLLGNQNLALGSELRKPKVKGGRKILGVYFNRDVSRKNVYIYIDIYIYIYIYKSWL